MSHHNSATTLVIPSVRSLTDNELRLVGDIIRESLGSGTHEFPNIQCLMSNMDVEWIEEPGIRIVLGERKLAMSRRTLQRILKRLDRSGVLIYRRGPRGANRRNDRARFIVIIPR